MSVYKTILLICCLFVPNFLSAALSIGLGTGGLGVGLGLGASSDNSSRVGSEPEAPTGLANSFYLRGAWGARQIDNHDALPYYDLGGVYLSPLLESEGAGGNNPLIKNRQSSLTSFAAGFLWRKGVSLDLGLDLGPSREFEGDIVHQNGIVLYEDLRMIMNARTLYAQTGIHWLMPLFPPKQYLIFSLGGRVGLSQMEGTLTVKRNFPIPPLGEDGSGAHDVVSSAFSQALMVQASWLMTPWLSLDISGMYENMVFNRIEVKNGRGYLEGVENVVKYDTNGQGSPMVWNFSGPSLRAGLTFYFKTPIAALRAPKISRQISEEDSLKSDKQRMSGDNLLNASLIPEAYAAYSSAVQINPGNVKAWYGLGSLFYRQKKYEQALGAYEKALELDADNKNLASFVNRLKTWLMRKKGQLN